MNLKMLILFFSLLILILLFAGCDCDEESIEDDDDELICHGDVCTDLTSGLMWQIEDTCEFCYFHEGIDHCKNLKQGGFDDWRMPTISEARSLIRGCPANEVGGPCTLTDDCLKEECYNDFCRGCEYTEGPGHKGLYAPYVFEFLFYI